MTDKPIIQASLVDTRNVGTDKELKIELRIPAEMATRFFEIFGWPTRVSPVPVALVPLKGGSPQEAVSRDAFERKPEEPPPHKDDFTKKPRVTQAGIRCSQPAFWDFLSQRFAGRLAGIIITSPEDAAKIVRWHCGVESRTALDYSQDGMRRWDALEAEFYAKSHGMRQ